MNRQKINFLFMRCVGDLPPPSGRPASPRPRTLVTDSPAASPRPASLVTHGKGTSNEDADRCPTEENLLRARNRRFRASKEVSCSTPLGMLYPNVL
jgi:hypothetical protein